MRKGATVSFEIPEGISCNIVNIRGSGKNVTVKIRSGSGTETVRFDTEVGDYRTYGVLMPASEAPGKILIELDDATADGSVFHLDAITMNEKKEAESITVRGGDAPANGVRNEILLDGIWNAMRLSI